MLFSLLNNNIITMKIPGYLGDIEFLREHPKILERLIELSNKKSLVPFIRNRMCTVSAGGFKWECSPEGYTFWNKVLYYKNTHLFYEKYPEVESINLSEGWIVETSNITESIEVANFIKTNKVTQHSIHYKFIINHKGLLGDNPEFNNLFAIIPEKAKHLPVLTFTQFKQLILNKNEKNSSSSTIRDPERGISIKLSSPKRQITTASRPVGNTISASIKKTRISHSTLKFGVVTN